MVTLSAPELVTAPMAVTASVPETVEAPRSIPSLSLNVTLFPVVT